MGESPSNASSWSSVRTFQHRHSCFAVSFMVTISLKESLTDWGSLKASVPFKKKKGLPQRWMPPHTFKQNSFFPHPRSGPVCAVSWLQLAWQRSDGLLWVAFPSNYILKRLHCGSPLGTFSSLTSSAVVVLSRDYTSQPPRVLLKYTVAQALFQTYTISISGDRSLGTCIS